MRTYPVIGSEYDTQRPEVELCSVQIPIGTCSKDRILVFGKEGYLFIYEGSNGANHQYHMAHTEAKELSSAWVDCIEARAAFAQDRSIEFAQIIVAEKASLLPELAPFLAQDGTPLLKHLSNSLSCHKYYVDSRTIFDDHQRYIAYPKTNGHMSPLGSFLLFRETLTRLGFLAPDVIFSEPRSTRCDLGDHFCGLQLYNSISYPDDASLNEFAVGLRLIQCRDAPEAGHIGAQMRWENSTAPIKKRALAFGNSFFERGGSWAHLSWWFAHWFEEFYFYWDPKMHHQVIEAYKPDVLICQTIERFLTHVPTS